MNDLRLLVVDKPLILPIRVPVRGLVSRADVIHSWSLPQVRIKSDAVPGRLFFKYFFCLLWLSLTNFLDQNRRFEYNLGLKN